MTQEFLTESKQTAAKTAVRGGPNPVPARAMEMHRILKLHSVLGNRRVAQLIQARRLTADGNPAGMQRKLTVVAAKDQYEREAGRIAKPVPTMPDNNAADSQTPVAQVYKDKIRSPQRRVPSVPRIVEAQLVQASPERGTVISRFPNAVTFGTYEPGLAIIPPIVKDGYDGSAHTAIKMNWGLSSWKRRWRVFDGADNLLYDSSYTYPEPNLTLAQDIIAKGKAGGKDKPWSVWHEVTETEIPFGGSDPDNFPYTYMKFNVFDTWSDLTADPDAKPTTDKQAGKPGEEPGKSSPVQSSVAKGAGSVVDYGSAVAMHEAYLREIYNKAASGITATAEELVGKGVPQTDVAKWATEARNVLKVKIRSDGNPILEKVFESRNLAKYGNKVGPSYAELVEKYTKKGVAAEQIDAEIIKGAQRTETSVNKWSGRLRVAGKITIFIDVALAGVRVYLAPEGEKTKVALEEVARIGGGLAGGAAGTEAGAVVGAAIGAAFAGVGAAPGAIIGGIIGGIAGAIGGGWLGSSMVDQIYDMLPPSDCVFEGAYSEESR